MFGDPIANELHLVRRTARALILTEWKLVKEPGELDRKAEEARRQTDSYAGSILGGIELKSTRYIVLVSRKNLQPPEDQTSDAVTFRHIVLAIAPDPHAREARYGPA